MLTRAVNRHPNRPALMGELRPEFSGWDGLCIEDASGEPTLDAPEYLPRGSSSAIVSETGCVLIVGACCRDGWKGRDDA